MMRKQYTAAFKTRVVQELLKEEKTLAQIAAEYARPSDPTEEVASCGMRRDAQPF
jgi:transposase-like protein